MGKFERDKELLAPIFKKVEAGIEISDAERMIAASTVYASYHDSGKIEGIISVDSSAQGCEFCKLMREIAEKMKTNGNDKHICGLCYATKGHFRYKTVKNRHELNMAILSEIQFKPGDFKGMGLYGLARINSDGDIRNVTHAKNIIIMMNDNPIARFGWWGKNINAIVEVCDELGKPKNCTLVASSFLIGKPIKLPKYFDYVFTVYETDEDVAEAVANGAAECNGKHCRDCGFMCYLGVDNGWKYGTNIAEKVRKMR